MIISRIASSLTGCEEEPFRTYTPDGFSPLPKGSTVCSYPWLLPFLRHLHRLPWIQYCCRPKAYAPFLSLSFTFFRFFHKYSIRNRKSQVFPLRSILWFHAGIDSIQKKSIMTPTVHNACSKIFGVFHLLYFDPKTDPNILYAVRNLTNVKMKK